MGMTRAKRYANHAGGRKYDRTAAQLAAEGGKRTELPKSTGHKGQDEKLAASEVFKEVWKQCTSDEDFVALREEWKAERKMWDKEQKARIKKEGDVKKESEDIEIKKEAKEDD